MRRGDRNVLVLTAAGVMCARRVGRDLLNELQQAVDGYIEVVNLRPDLPLPSDLCMVINEDGKLWGLPTNVAASILYDSFRAHDRIVGTAVLLRRSADDLQPLTQLDVLRIAETIQDMPLPYARWKGWAP